MDQIHHGLWVIERWGLVTLARVPLVDQTSYNYKGMTMRELVTSARTLRLLRRE